MISQDLEPRLLRHLRHLRGCAILHPHFQTATIRP